MIVTRTVHQHWPWILFAAGFGLTILTLISLSFGAVNISPAALMSLFSQQPDDLTQVIIFELRLPRALLALCVGAMLAASGAATQGLFRNPLADPSLIGVGAGAAAGASIVIVLVNAQQWSIAGLSIVTAGAFLGAIITVILVYKIATGVHGTSVTTMLLTGIAMTFLAGSLSNVLEFLADNEMLRRISLWRMGGLESADYSRVSIAFFVCVVVMILLPWHSSALNALLLGESEARHLGIDVNKVKRHLIFIVAAAVGTSVALAGMISFIGLIVPHIVRLIVGPNHRYLIPLSALLGALLMVIADSFARTIIAPTELPVGIVTAILGAPVFISLLLKRHQYGMQ